MRRAAKWLAWTPSGTHLRPGGAAGAGNRRRQCRTRPQPAGQPVPGITGGQVGHCRPQRPVSRTPSGSQQSSCATPRAPISPLHDVALDWSPLRLAQRTLDIDRLTAASGKLARQPEPSASSSSSIRPAGQSSCCIRCRWDGSNWRRRSSAPPYALALDGSGRLDSYTAGQGTFAVTRLDAAAATSWTPMWTPRSRLGRSRPTNRRTD